MESSNSNKVESKRSQDAESKTLNEWRTSNVWKDVSELNKGSLKWTVHDGPPFANGHLHVGHALNKVLKDSLAKFHRSQGKHVDFVLGWDCHGLPVEYAVTQENPGLKDPRELRVKCRQYANHWVETQKAEFQKLGVVADYDHSYKTMDFPFEADVLRVFGMFVKHGLVEKRLMTVPWCGYCSSTLAKAEMEYKQKTDTSCFVLFPLSAASLECLKGVLKEKNVNVPLENLRFAAFVAWTTTPYSLPLNRALALSPVGKMALVRVLERGKLCFKNDDVSSYPLFLLGSESAKEVLQKVGVAKYEFVCELENSLFAKLTGKNDTTEKWTVSHPFESNVSVPVLLDVLVELKEKNDKATNKEEENEGEENAQPSMSKPSKQEQTNTNKQEGKAQKKKTHGVVSTGVVHLAPGLGVEDYRVGVTHKLELFCPVSKFGTFEQNDHLPAQLVGKPLMTEGKTWALQSLRERDLLFYQEPLTHSYPHCWRCKNALLFRTTEQYFCAYDPTDVKHALKEQGVQFVPPDGREEFERVLSNRGEWCVSRQRVFGVPVVAVNFETCGHSFFSAEMVEFVARGVEKAGLDYWADVNEQELVSFLPAGCPRCKSTDVRKFTKEKDVLDVWFDSGSTNYAVLKRNPSLNFPADVYVEGKDQYRGWFQSSFLCSYVANERMTPVKTVVTHGFVVDDQGRKFSKSLGNGVGLEEAMKRTNADTVRLWALTTDYSKDVALSFKLLDTVAGEYRKLRSSLRFMLQNVCDGTFDPQRDLLPFDELHPADQHMLVAMNELCNTFKKSFESFDTNMATTALLAYFRAQVSSFYAEFTKNRLYFEHANSTQRKQVQTTLYLVLKHALPMLAPVCTFLAEEVFQFMYSFWPNVKPSKSVLLMTFQNANPAWSFAPNVASLWSHVLELRHEVNKEVERERDKHARTGRPSNQQMHVSVFFDLGKKDMKALFKFMTKEFAGKNQKGLKYEFYAADFFLVSSCDLFAVSQLEGDAPFAVQVKVLSDEQYAQCWRCRRYQAGVDPESHVCARCNEFLSHLH